MLILNIFATIIVVLNPSSWFAWVVAVLLWASALFLQLEQEDKLRRMERRLHEMAMRMRQRE